jgi:TRAP-type C4-dicarboxylate transport system substrate-binding protein
MKTTPKIVVVGLSVIALLVMGGSALAEKAPKKINLKMQCHLIPSDTQRVLGKYVKNVSELSDGQIKIKLFPGSSIIPMKEVLEGVGNGTLEMAMIAEGYWHKLIPVSEVAGLPFAFKNISEAKYFMMERGFADMLKQEYAKHNVHHIPYEAYPVGLMTNKPIKGVADIKGMKIRAYGVMAEWLTQMGASTTYIPGGELYTALATGVVDGAHWGDAGPMYVMKFQEVLKNYMKPEPIVGGWNNLIVNMDVWKKLSPVQQKIIETAAMAEGMSRLTDDTRMLGQTSLRSMKNDWNVEINQVPEAELENMRAAAMVVWDKTAKKDPTNAKAIGMMKEFLKELGHIQ